MKKHKAMLLIIDDDDDNNENSFFTKNISVYITYTSITIISIQVFSLIVCGDDKENCTTLITTQGCM